MDEFGAFSVAIDGQEEARHLLVLIMRLFGYETAGERIEMEEGGGEGGFEAVDDLVGGEGRREVGDEKEALLDVMDGENGEIPWRQVAALGREWWGLHRACGEVADWMRRRRQCVR